MTTIANQIKRLTVGLSLLLAIPATIHAQYTYTTNNNAITITGYNGAGGVVNITNIINGLPVTTIGYNAFSGKTNVTSITIPTSVTTIGDYAFSYCIGLTSVTIPSSVPHIGGNAFAGCTGLTSVTIPHGVTIIGYDAFYCCTGLTSVTIPNSVATIQSGAFMACTRLTNVTIPASVTFIGGAAFYDCANLTSVYFLGNAPALEYSNVFSNSYPTVYYLAGTTGWTNPWGRRPTVCWNPSAQNLGVQGNQFKFSITGSTGLVIVVEACTNLVNPVWVALSTNTLTSGSSSFSDPQWTNHSQRFYRFRAP